MQKVIAIRICRELPFLILSVSIYYGAQSDIRVKIYYPLNLLVASIFNFERLHKLQDSIEHPTKNFLRFEHARGFHFSFRASQYIMRLNWTPE